MSSNRKWTGDSTTIFYQGMFSGQVQAAKYTGTRGFRATTGEHVVHKGAFDVIFKPFIGQELEELVLLDKTKNYGVFQTLQHYVVKLGRWWQGVDIKPTTDNISVAAHSFNWDRISIAQDTDINAHKKKVETLGTNNDIRKILFGVSRGAATTFCAMAKNQYEGIRLVVLEGCPHSVINVLEGRYPYASGLTYKVAKWMFPAHKEDGPSPIKLVKDFPAGVPVVFITSRVDKSVNAAGTTELAKTLAREGKNPVYLLQLEKSSHNGYMFDDAEDRENYQNFLHAIYKRYDLAYIPDFAERITNVQKYLLQ